MALCENRWEALEPGDSRLYTWTLKDFKGNQIVRLTTRHGAVGFVIMHFVLWFHEVIEPLNAKGTPPDDGGYNWRPVRGASVLSNHCGYAVDLNWTKHPLAKIGTFLKPKALLIRLKLRTVYRGVLKWGGDYRNRKDEMHFEIGYVGMRAVELVAKRLMNTTRGKRILEANPTQKKVILS